jgi:carbamate kinase
MVEGATVVALGGNALIRAREHGSYGEQRHNVQITAAALADLARAGHRLVITHGNGPQVGNILLQQECASETVPPMPLDVCGAETQGQIGYMFQQALADALDQAGLPHSVATIITQTLVDTNSPAFKNPSKPIGPFYDEALAERLRVSKGWTIIEDSGRGYRRVVASPEPIDIVEKAAIRLLADSGVVVIASGGGGIPVARDDSGRLRGVEAVIDKDRAAALLATLVGARLLLVLTDADQVALNYGTAHQVDLDRITVSEARAYASSGHFPPGSMGPKIEGAVYFLTHGGERVIITRPGLISTALEGKAGTHILPDSVSIGG